VRSHQCGSDEAFPDPLGLFSQDHMMKARYTQDIYVTVERQLNAMRVRTPIMSL
jgi:hypothetical protein